jgi:flagellar hook-basal body complex protein FliE
MGQDKIFTAEELESSINLQRELIKERMADFNSYLKKYAKKDISEFDYHEFNKLIKDMMSEIEKANHILLALFTVRNRFY